MPEQIKNVIFIGSPIPIKDIDKYKTLSFNIADNIAQNTMVEGLYAYYGDKLRVISELSDKRVNELNIVNGVTASVIHSNNSNKIIYYLSLLIEYTKSLNTILKQQGDKYESIIITRGSYIYIALPVLFARMRYRNVKWVPFIITTIEVPEYKFPFSAISKMSRWTTKRADAMIAYVAKTAEDYMPGKPFLEIVYTINDRLVGLYKNDQFKKPKKFTITYTGSLSNTYNFDYIIDAITKTSSKYRWVFAGTGVYADKIKQLSQSKEYDVDYKGTVSNIEAIKLQQSSHLLLCPRGGNLTKAGKYYTKYAASGKLIEYLCSGTPILATDVPSTLNEIKKYMTNESGQMADALIKDIARIEKNYASKLKTAKKGQIHALTYFNSKYQNKKIYKFLESL